MKNNLFACIGIATLLALPAFAQEVGGLSADERTELLELLESSRRQTEELAAQGACEIWSKKPAEDRWSVAEVLEHLVLTEEGIFATAHGALEQAEDPDWQALEAASDVAGLVAGIQDRSQKFPAPAQFVPTGEIERDELLRRFGAVRAVTIDFVRRTQAPLKRHTATGPPGKMNVHMWLGLIAGHNLRHNLQIAEVLEQLKGC